MTSLAAGFRMQPGMSVNSQGVLHFAGISLTELAAQYGTPLYVLNEQTILDNCRRYLAALQAEYPHSQVAYASKAFLCQAMCRLLAQAGMGLDVVSGGELFTAESVGFPGERIIFHGINRSPSELRQALRYGVGRIVVDNFAELERIGQAAAELSLPANLLIRVTTGVAAHTHQYVQTSVLDSKFGFRLEEISAALDQADRWPGVTVRGLHCHIGSQIMSAEPFLENLRILVAAAAGIRHRASQPVEINVGGGLAAYYTPQDQPEPIEALVAKLAAATRAVCRELALPEPRLVLEPGRSIVNEAGLTLYRVGGCKQIPGVRNYLLVDGSMADNIRPALYQSHYETLLAERMQDPVEQVVSIAGRCCESGDMLAWDQSLPAARPGDLLVVARTGAYNYSMASNYNRLPRPAVVLLSGGSAHVIVERESYQDLIRLDRLPPHLS